jgi:cytochrome c
MSAHPALKLEDANSIVKWILTLADTGKKAKSLPVAGSILPKADPKQPLNTLFELSADYTDNGGPGIRALSATKTVQLRSNVMDAVELDDIYGFVGKDSLKDHYLIFPADTGSFGVGKVSLAGIGSIEITGLGKGVSAGYKIEVLMDSNKGKQIGESTISFKAGKQKASAQIALKALPDLKAHKYYVVFKQVTGVKGGRDLPWLKTLRFVPGK